MSRSSHTCLLLLRWNSVVMPFTLCAQLWDMERNLSLIENPCGHEGMCQLHTYTVAPAGNKFSFLITNVITK